MRIRLSPLSEYPGWGRIRPTGVLLITSLLFYPCEFVVGTMSNAYLVISPEREGIRVTGEGPDSTAPDVATFNEL